MTKAFLRRQRRKAAAARRNGTFLIPSGTSLTNFGIGNQVAYYGSAPTYVAPTSGSYTISSVDSSAGTYTISTSSGAALSFETIQNAANVAINPQGSVAGQVQAITEAYEAGLLSDAAFLRTLGL